MKLIKKLFIKNYTKTNDPTIRNQYGIVAGIFGTLSNILLFIIKLIIAIPSNTITILVDAVNNLSDAGSSAVTLIGFKLSSKPSDREHPFGYARYEHITGLIIAMIIFAVGVIFAESSIEKIITPQKIQISIIMYIVLGISIAIKFSQMLLFFNFAKSINSRTLRANGIDARNDTLSTTCVLLSIIIMDIFSINIDGYIGLAVSLFIIYSSTKLLRETINPLISEKPDKKTVNKIKQELLNFDGVKDIHDLKIHTYGTSSLFACVHIEIPINMNLLEAHELVSRIEEYFEDTYNIDMVIQTEPIDRSSPEIIELQEKITQAIQSINKKLTIHCLRVKNKNNYKTVFFDIMSDHNVNLKKSTVDKVLDNSFRKESNNYIFIYNIDKPYL